MTRKELYQTIKENDLAVGIKTYYDKHYTNCSNVELEYFIGCMMKPDFESKLYKLRALILDFVGTLASTNRLSQVEVEEFFNGMKNI
jgi:CTP synthase (UTP-ammonia lyase)